MLERIPPPVALGVNAAGPLLALNSPYRLWIVVLGLALPFSVLRAWRWWRRLRPRRGLMAPARLSRLSGGPPAPSRASSRAP